MGNREDILAQQWLAAREDQHWHAGGLEVVHDLEHFGG